MLSDKEMRTEKSGERLPLAPPYQRVREQLRSAIQAGRWSAGARIPSRKDLAQEYGVAVATLDRAMASLLEEGTLRTDGPRGTFVAEASSMATAGNNSPSKHWSPADQNTVLPAQKIQATLGILGAFAHYDMQGEEAAHFWIRTILNSIEGTFSTAGGRTHFFRRNRPDQGSFTVREAMEELLAENVDGLIILLEDAPHEIETIVDCVGNRQIPLVFITSGEIRRPLTHVFYDNTDAGYTAASHLLQNGRRKLLFFAPFAASWAEERIQGAREAVQRDGTDARLEIYPAVPLLSPLFRDSDRPLEYPQARTRYRELSTALARDLFQKGLEADGVIAADDYLAMTFLDIAGEAGKTVGKDFGLVGFDNNPEARLRGLTSVQPPLETLGREAARLILQMLRQEPTSLQVRLRSHLIPRTSTRVAR